MKKQNLLLISIIFGTLMCSINTKAQTISGGGYHTLGICNSNIPRSWGNDSEGQLGNSNGNYTYSLYPDTVSILTGIIAVAAGEQHSLALKNNGTVWTFGFNLFGQIGNGTSGNHYNTAQVVSSLSAITAIAAGWNHSFALKNDSTLWAWGYNTFGQLGIGTNSDTAVPAQVTPLTGLTKIIAVAGGQLHSIALKSDGTVWAWGDSYYGQLGNGTSGFGAGSNVPLQVNNLIDIIAISAGGYHSLALKNDGTVWAWGHNNEGQLGDSSNVDSNVPVQVDSISDVIAIAAGERHSLALKNDGTVWAWGRNNVGQLGNGNNPNSNVPVPVSTSTLLTNIISISAGFNHSVAVKNDGTVRAWGLNSWGQLGNGNTINSNMPQPITTLCQVLIPTEIKEITESLSSAIYPNPTNGIFTLSINQDFNSHLRKIEIYNTLGEKIYAQNITSPQEKVVIDLSAQSKGIYIVKFESNDFQKTQKLIITK